MVMALNFIAGIPTVSSSFGIRALTGLPLAFSTAETKSLGLPPGKSKSNFCQVNCSVPDAWGDFGGGLADVVD
jgi:hypothetical protein